MTKVELERMSQISLTAPMRSNLLSLQNIARQQSIVQNRLATGLKVSSAIDNPSAYYTAASLSNRAADLTALLDAMSQGVQTIKTASEAISSATKFLEQAKATANQALETSQPIAARVSTEEELLAAIESGKKGLIVIEGEINIDSSQIILHDGQSLVGNQYFGSNKVSRLNLTNNLAGGAIQLGNNSVISDLELNFTAQTNSQRIISADAVKNATVRNLKLDFTVNNESLGSFASLSSENGAELKLEGYFISSAVGRSTRFMLANNQGKATIASSAVINHKGEGNIIRGIEFYTNAYLKIERGAIVNFDLNNTGSSTFLGIYMNEASADINGAEINIRLKSQTAKASGLDILSGNFCISGESKINIETNAPKSNGFWAEVGGIFDISDKTKINIKNKSSDSDALYISDKDSSINLLSSQIQLNIISDNMLSFKNATNGSNSFNIIQGATISWSNIDKSAQGIWLAQNNQQIISNTTETINGFDGKTEFNKTSGTANEIADFSASLDSKIDNKSPSSIPYDYKQYNFILEQFDMLISDASYKGVNLLQGQNLKINFNEDRSSMIEVPGYDVNTENLGLVTKEWNSQEDIEKSISELEGAISSLRSFASAFGNYYSIVTTRQDFTENLINVLEEGADKLTLADMNEESANMLALQTSQQLAVNSLSLASQAAQSVLKLF